MKPINRKARTLAATEAVGQVVACAPLPSECTTVHAPGIETGPDNKSIKKLCNPYMRDVEICHMWPGQVPGWYSYYGMSSEKVQPQDAIWHNLCGNWQTDTDLLPVVTTLELPTDQQTTGDLWDSAVKDAAGPYLSDLAVRDNLADTGAEPSGGNFWESPDVFFRNQLDDPAAFSTYMSDYHEDPVAQKDNWLYCRVRNIGSQPVLHATVKFFIALPWSVNPDWAPIAHTMLHRIQPGEVKVVRAMAPYIPPSATAHACLAAIVDSPQDFVRIIDWTNYQEAVGPTPDLVDIPQDNNVTQRNIKIVAGAPGAKFFRVPIGLGAHLRGQRRGVADLAIDARTLPVGARLVLGFANVAEEALREAKLSAGVKRVAYEKPVYPWLLRSADRIGNLAFTLDGLASAAASRQPGPHELKLPGLVIPGGKNATIRRLALAFDDGKPPMAELQIELPGNSASAEHRIVMQMLDGRRRIGGATLVLRTRPPELFRHVLDVATGHVHALGSAGIHRVPQHNQVSIYDLRRVLAGGARLAKE